MTTSLKALLSDLNRFDELDRSARAECVVRTAALSSASDEDLTSALAAIERLIARGASHSPGRPPQLDDCTLESILQHLPRGGLTASAIERLCSLYCALGGVSGSRPDVGPSDELSWRGPEPRGSETAPPEQRGLSPRNGTPQASDSGEWNRSRRRLLAALAFDASPRALAAFADLVATDPPRQAQDADVAFAPLFRRRELSAATLFPRLLGALQFPATAALVLDLANHLTRTRRVARHPAADRAVQLIALLGNVVDRLRRLEERPAEFGSSAADLRQVVAEGMPLVVGLCDALGWIGDERAVGKLNQALQLGHRRLRTEAAAALARLGQDRGREALVELTAQPVARTRALVYLDELGLLDRVPENRRSPAARAEGEFAEWLSRPEQFGLAPQALSLVDQCRQRWPGYEEAVDCYLFDFEYHLPQGDLSGVGIAGPLLHCLAADLSDLPPADIYAAYAGWCAEHEEIKETAAADLPPEALERFQSLAAGLRDLGYVRVQLVKRGEFFGEELWVAAAVRSEVSGVLVLDGREVHWFPSAVSRRPLGPTEAYDIVKGRKLLRVFNP